MNHHIRLLIIYSLSRLNLAHKSSRGQLQEGGVGMDAPTMLFHILCPHFGAVRAPKCNCKSVSQSSLTVIQLLSLNPSRSLIVKRKQSPTDTET